METKAGAHSNSQKILFFTALPVDSETAVAVLRDVQLEAVACKDLSELCQQAQRDCGAIVISDDAIDADGLYKLRMVLTNQEPWSDIPVILLTSKTVTQANEMFDRIGNVSLLEKPFSRLTLVRAAQVALRARNKQYEVRDLFKALERSKNDAEHANASKTEFLANMSHEIRTPIGAILGFLDLMKNPANDDQENSHYMGIVERNSQQLLRLIDDILDLSKVEAGKMTIERVQFPLTDLLVDLTSNMSFKASEKEIEFHVRIDGLIPNHVCSDPVRLRQILSNIIGNAIKFTPQGSVELVISYQDPYLTFTVNDTGVGITPEQAQKLFQPFSQADTSTTRKFGGTGLGLVLSKRLSEAMGGSLKLVTSEYGKGSTFAIQIKPELVAGSQMVGRQALIYSDQHRRYLKTDQVLKGLKVLLVEDSPDNQMLISTYLKKSGAIIQTASDGRQGVEMASRENFDVMLMDVQMPHMDGHEATRYLRGQHYSKPIVALTAHAMNEERNRCFESGFTDFLTKPIQKDVLLNVLARYVPKSLHS